MNPSIQPCYVCGRKVGSVGGRYTFGTDVREKSPTDGFEAFEPVGDLKAGCSDHPVECFVYRLDGTAEKMEPRPI